jgi:hypothetical protein
MMYPILCKVRFEELNLVFKEKALWKQLAFSFIANWIIAPLVMVFPVELALILAWSRMGFSSRQAGLQRRSHPRRSSSLHRHGPLPSPSLYCSKSNLVGVGVE